MTSNVPRGSQYVRSLTVSANSCASCGFSRAFVAAQAVAMEVGVQQPAAGHPLESGSEPVRSLLAHPSQSVTGSEQDGELLGRFDGDVTEVDQPTTYRVSVVSPHAWNGRTPPSTAKATPGSSDSRPAVGRPRPARESVEVIAVSEQWEFARDLNASRGPSATPRGGRHAVRVRPPPATDHRGTHGLHRRPGRGTQRDHADHLTSCSAPKYGSGPWSSSAISSSRPETSTARRRTSAPSSVSTPSSSSGPAPPPASTSRGASSEAEVSITVSHGPWPASFATSPGTVRSPWASTTPSGAVPERPRPPETCGRSGWSA